MLFENTAAHRMPTLTLQLLKEMSITTPEDMYAAFPRLFDATLLEAELKKLSTAMKAKGDALVPQVVWTTNEAAEPGATEVPLLRRVVHRAKQAHQASLSFDKADAHRKEQKRLLKEEALGASKASERDAQRSLKMHNELTDMCCYKVAPSDQAPPKVVCKLHDAMISGTLCAADLELKKFVLRSQQIEASDKKTRIGEDGEITKPEFLAYCLGNRNMCPNDEYYLTVFQNGWKLNEDAPGGGSASTLNLARVEAVLRDKIYQKSEGSSEKAMKAVFKFFDTDGSGKVELKEFGKAMERFGIILMDDEMEGLFKRYDVDNSGAMDYQEFIKGLMSVEPPETSNG